MSHTSPKCKRVGRLGTHSLALWACIHRHRGQVCDLPVLGPVFAEEHHQSYEPEAQASGSPSELTRSRFGLVSTHTADILGDLPVRGPVFAEEDHEPYEPEAQASGSPSELTRLRFGLVSNGTADRVCDMPARTAPEADYLS